MSTAAENLQHALQRSWSAWGDLARVWQSTLLETYAAVAEWAVEEGRPTKISSTKVMITPTRRIQLVPKLYGQSDPDRALIPVECVELDPPELDVPADGSVPEGVVVVVTVTIPADVADDAYEGVLVDQDGNVVEDDVYVTILK